MALLILGLMLWTGLHLLRNLAPSWRAAMQDRMGDGSKGVIALGILASVALMVMGYRSAAFVPLWTPPVALTHLNNLLMVLAFYMYFTTATKPGTAFVFGTLKNPQMTGFKVWAVAHLLVNGDLASVILFGGLLAWAVAQVVLSRGKPSAVNRDTAPIASPWLHLGLVACILAGTVTIHAWLGVWPLGG